MFALAQMTTPGFPMTGLAMMDGQTGTRGTCAVRLIDRRTGTAHRVNGRPLLIYTRNPEAAVAELLRGRDPSIWEALVEPIWHDNQR